MGETSKEERSKYEDGKNEKIYNKGELREGKGKEDTVRLR